MSEVLKINKKIKVQIQNDNLADQIISESELKEKERIRQEEYFKNQIEEAYKKGYGEGRQATKIELENEFNNKMLEKSEEFYHIISSFEEKILTYEVSFEKIVIEVSKKISEKILQYELKNKNIIENTLKNSVSKILGANEIIVKINPKDYEIITNEGQVNNFEQAFSKIKFEQDSSIMPGGCLVITEIGNIDARISAQLNEIIKQLENNLINIVV